MYVIYYELHGVETLVGKTDRVETVAYVTGELARHGWKTQVNYEAMTLDSRSY